MRKGKKKKENEKNGKRKKFTEYISLEAMGSSMVDMKSVGWIQRCVNVEPHQILGRRTSESSQGTTTTNVSRNLGQTTKPCDSQ